LLTEGYKREGENRIEVSRSARSDELICLPDQMLALVTDNDSLECDGVPRFGLDDARGVADLVQDRFLKGAL
jgi:molybdopterin-guanine dinucleotide biosynthesis protein B